MDACFNRRGARAAARPRSPSGVKASSSRGRGYRAASERISGRGVGSGGRRMGGLKTGHTSETIRALIGRGARGVALAVPPRRAGSRIGMSPIVSRTTNERIIRMSIMAVILVPYTIMSYYDGIWRYPHHNLTKAIENLPVKPASLPEINRGITRAAVADVQPGTPLSELRQRFGAPGWEQAPDVRYFGPGGTLRLEVTNGRVQRAGWEPGGKSETDLKFQIWIGVVLTAIAVPFLWFFFARVLGFRCVLSDAGLKHPGDRLIPFESMRSLTYVKSGLFDLTYDANGASRTLHLDDYKIKAFNEVVDEICRRRGFPWPVRS
jgi:hypothetical protein